MEYIFLHIFYILKYECSFCPYSKKDIFLDSMAVTAKEWTFLALTYDGTTQEMGIFKDDLYAEAGCCGPDLVTLESSCSTQDSDGE